MVSVQQLHPGMRVKIVPHWVDGCHQNTYGRMDHYLGTIVTVQEIFNSDIYGGYFTIEEDSGEFEGQDGHWHWFGESVDCIIDELELPDFEVSADDELSSFLFSLM